MSGEWKSEIESIKGITRARAQLILFYRLVIVHTKSAPASTLSVKGIKFL